METKALSELKGLISGVTQDLKQIKAAFTALKAFTGVKNGTTNDKAVAMSYREFTAAITVMRKRLDRIVHISGMRPRDGIAAATGTDEIGVDLTPADDEGRGLDNAQ